MKCCINTVITHVPCHSFVGRHSSSVSIPPSGERLSSQMEAVRQPLLLHFPVQHRNRSTQYIRTLLLFQLKPPRGLWTQWWKHYGLYKFSVIFWLNITTNIPCYSNSVCVRSITWSGRAGRPAGGAMCYHWTEGKKRRREKVVLQSRGFVLVITESLRGDWVSWWMMAWREVTRTGTRTDRVQLQSWTCTGA